MKSRRIVLRALVGAAITVGLGLPLWSLGAVATRDPRLATKTAGADVVISLTPKKVKKGRFLFDLAADTHQGELADVDLRSNTRLLVGDRVLAPVEVPTLRGHHARGRLAFELEEIPDRFSVVIRNVRSEPELRFDWP